MSDHSYFDVYYQSGTNPVFCYRSGLAVYEESLVDGSFVSLGYNAAGYPLNVLTNFPSRIKPQRFAEPFAFQLEINGAAIGYDLQFVDFQTQRTDTDLHAILTLDSTIAPVRVKVHTLLDGTQMFTRWLEVENRSDTPVNISHLGLISGGLETMDRKGLTLETEPSKLYSYGCFDEDSWGREGDFAWHALRPDTTALDTRYNRSRYRHPLLFLRNNVTGTLWFTQIAWSGGCRFTMDYCATPERTPTSLAFQAEITGYNPLLVLAAGETFTTPEVHMGVIQGGLDEAVNEMHAHVRKSVLNLPEADGSACLVGAGMGAEHDMSVETSKAFIDQFAEMGAEVFIIDAGWQNPPHEETAWTPYNGINHPNPDRYPNGLEELSDYCHAKGMKFALWVEIERLGVYSDVYKNHPEWRICDTYGKQTESFLDFTNPEAAQWAEDELARIIVSYKLDLLRVDYNFMAHNYFAIRRAGHTRECATLRHFQAVYAMYRRLKKRFPQVVFENCAGGGGRTDLGMMKAFHHTWVSDCQDLPYSVTITNGMTMALPPERVDRLFAGMGCHRYGGLDAHMRNTMFGHMTLNVVAPAATTPNSIQMDFVRHSVQLYKDFIRPFLPTCKVFHHTPEAKKTLAEGISILEIAAADSSRGVLGVFTLTGSGSKTVSCVCKGADPGKRYRVTLDNTRSSFEISGAALALEGLSISVPTALSSELICYEAL